MANEYRNNHNGDYEQQGILRKPTMNLPVMTQCHLVLAGNQAGALVGVHRAYIIMFLRFNGRQSRRPTQCNLFGTT